MNPVCFTIGDRPVYWYGVMVAAAFLAVLVHWSLFRKKEGFPPGFGSDLGFWLMLSGILGARAAYVISNWDYYAAQPVSVLRIDQGGLIYYGGMIGAIAGGVLFTWIKKKPMLAVADFAISAIPLGHAIGRIGCFLNGCCYGSVTEHVIRVHVADAWRHPTQLYEAGLNLMLYAGLLLLYQRRPFRGALLCAYLLVYPLTRFFIEFLRGDPRMDGAGGINAAQTLSVALFLTGCLLTFLLVRDHIHAKHTHSS